MHFHEFNRHANLATTNSLLLTKFCIIKGRLIVRVILINCLICKNYIKQHYHVPNTQYLPNFKVEQEAPLCNVGIDLNGSLIVKGSDLKMTKCYVVLITFTTTKVVTLELVQDVFSYQFELAFCRVVSRGGAPHLVISDNGSNFRGLNHLLLEIVRQNNFIQYLDSISINCLFIPPLIPCCGGFYERLVGLIKHVIKRFLAKKKNTLG